MLNSWRIGGRILGVKIYIKIKMVPLSINKFCKSIHFETEKNILYNLDGIQNLIPHNTQYPTIILYI